MGRRHWRKAKAPCLAKTEGRPAKKKLLKPYLIHYFHIDIAEIRPEYRHKRSAEMARLRGQGCPVRLCPLQQPKARPPPRSLEPKKGLVLFPL